MTDIAAKDVMKLRQKTGLSMMQCKKALIETKGDQDAAEEFLRKKLKGKMEARTDRAAGEGKILIRIDDAKNACVILEIRTETDFTANNDDFKRNSEEIARMSFEAEAGTVAPTAEMQKLIDDLRISTNENISIARIEKLQGEPGDSIGNYVHHDGKTGVVVHARGPVDKDVLRQICMHVTAAVPRPLGVSPDDIPADQIEKERKFRTEQAIESGKPEDIAKKIVDGGMRKFFEEVALLEQPFVVDPTKGKIKDLVGKDGTILGFRRWQIGEEG